MNIDNPRKAATQQSYRSAASVLSNFDSELLQPIEKALADDGDAVLELLEECERVRVEPEGWRWMLKNSVRRQVLKDLGTRDAIRHALQANAPRPDDTLQRMFEAYIEQSAPPIEQQSVTELTATLQVMDWLEGILDNLPERAALINRLEWQQLLQPFRQLVGDHFCGRTKELADLRGFFLTGERHRTIYEAKPMMVYSPGGVGKSTLVAKFILETVDDESAAKNFAFCYWDFDRATLLPEQPLTLLAELVLQLGLQFVPIKALAQELRQRWLNKLSESIGTGRGIQTEAGQRGTKAFRDLVHRSIQTSQYDLASYILEFEKLIDELPAGHQIRLLLVLDTFERVQEVSFELTRVIWDFLNELQAVFPRMRVIVSGRAELSQEVAHRPYLLEELDEEAAKEYLAVRGVTHPELAAAIFKRVGGDPLSLHLVVNGLRQEHDLESLRTLPPDFDELSMDHELNQEWLYRRYLSRIQDPAVRRLAHPGLVLRRVTPELIRQVLAVPCKVHVPTEEVAEELFERLAEQVSLVSREGPRMLRHRPDVRKRMLRALVQTEPTVFDIHQRAVEFYAQQPPTPETRAEEIYHRLCIAHPRDELDARWLPEVAAFLRDAIDEVPPKERGYLISKLQITSVTFDWNEADAQSKEDFLATRVQDAIAVNQLDEALQLLSQLRERLPGSKLYRLEALALERLGRYPEARIVANEGLFSARKAGNVELELDLLLVAVRANETLGQYERAKELLDEAEQADVKLEPLAAKLLLLEFQMHRLRLCRLDPANCDSATSTLGELVYQTLNPLFEIVARRSTLLLLDIVEEIGVAYPETLLRVIELFPSVFEAENSQQQITALLQEWYHALGSRQSRVDENSLIQPGDSLRFFRDLFDIYTPTQPLVSGLVRLVRDTLTRGQHLKTAGAALLDQTATALFSAFETRDELLAFLKEEFPNESMQLDWDMIYSDLLLNVATLFERQGKAESLIARALANQPDNTLLADLLHQFAASVAQRVEQPGVPKNGNTIGIYIPSLPREQQLAALPKVMPPFISATSEGQPIVAPELVFNWALGMRQAMRAVCMVEGVQASGTGFLVAPNLVLCPHFLGESKGDERKTRFRFDYYHAPDGSLGTPTIYVTAAEWLVAMNAELGYKLLRLEGMPGMDLVPGESITRGWLSLNSTLPLPGQGLFMLYHGLTRPQTLEYTLVKRAATGEIQLTSDFPMRSFGAAGAPCCNEAWEVIAIRLSQSLRPNGPESVLGVRWVRDLLTDPLFSETLKQHLPEPEGGEAARLARLTQTLVDSFNFEELQAFASTLSIEWETLSGETRTEKARSLIDHASSAGKLDELVHRGREQRPGARWE